MSTSPPATGVPPYFRNLLSAFQAIAVVYTSVLERTEKHGNVAQLLQLASQVHRSPISVKHLTLIKALLPDTVALHTAHASEAADPYEDRRIKRHKRSGSAEEYIPPMSFIINDRASRHSMPPRKAIQLRKDYFERTLDDYLSACRAAAEDPISLLELASQENVAVRIPDITDAHAILQNMHEPDPIPSILRKLKQQPFYEDHIHSEIVVPPRSPVYADWDDAIVDASLRQTLQTSFHVDKLYAHQDEALRALKNKHVLVTTPTSSGKSLIFQIPVIQALEQDSAATCLFVYPTKALAQDQLQKFRRTLAIHDLPREAATFDGDTTDPHTRARLIDEANVLFTNPDIIHCTLLPNETKWRRFLQNLKFLIIDEVHYYSGAFGSHVAWVIRRLRRVCHVLGNDSVRIVMCSATLNNPLTHGSLLTGIHPEDIHVIDKDTSPAGAKSHLVWQPPLDRDEIPVSQITEATRLMSFFIKNGLRVIVFCRVRSMCERLLLSVRADFARQNLTKMASLVQAYRAGYQAHTRREIEHDMFQGRILGLISTNALELGIDIGSLDVVLTLGFPYSVAGYRQQAGRAGRRSRDSMAFFLADNVDRDLYFVNNPEALVHGPVEDPCLDVSNPFIAADHILCAGHEMPIDVDLDTPFLGDPFELESYCRESLAHAHGMYCAGPNEPHPAREIPIRSVESASYDIFDADSRNLIESMERERAYFSVYEGAVYVSRGVKYLVLDVNHTSCIVLARRAPDIDYFTDARDFSNIDPVYVKTSKKMPTYLSDSLSSSLSAYPSNAVAHADVALTFPCGQDAYTGPVEKCTVVFGFFKMTPAGVTFDTEYQLQEPFIKGTHGFWLNLASQMETHLVPYGGARACLHSLAHAVIAYAHREGLCSPYELSTECRCSEVLSPDDLQDKSTRPQLLAKLRHLSVRPARLMVIENNPMDHGRILAKIIAAGPIFFYGVLSVLESCACEDDGGCAECFGIAECHMPSRRRTKSGAWACLSMLLNSEGLLQPGGPPPPDDVDARTRDLESILSGNIKA